MSPLLQWRRPAYIAAGFSGVFALSLLLLQPLLIAGLLPGLSRLGSRRFHKFVGGVLVLLVVAHVFGLWLTSPPDVIDALLLVSPTPFSIWGVLAMWCLFAAAILVALRSRIPIPAHRWRQVHRILVGVTVIGSVIHALMIEGAMGTISKIILCAIVVLTAGYVLSRKT
ncbi:MAG: ferric reductase-like transmembrane domain-containing protein [Granulosicoccus sp.]|nr:ferric reductase-like transmembrane domain-containing protein [Granulosicoccus sp.]